MNQQPLDQPQVSKAVDAGDALPALGSSSPRAGDGSENEMRALLARQIAGVTRGKAPRREIPAAAQTLLTLEGNIVELPGNGRTSTKTAVGTMLTPDQDAMAMDATIPQCPEPHQEE